MELRALVESGGADFGQFLSQRAVGVPGPAGPRCRRARERRGGAGRGLIPSAPAEPPPGVPSIHPPAPSAGPGVRTPPQPKPPVGLNCVSRVSPSLFLFANGRRQWLSHFLHLSQRLGLFKRRHAGAGWVLPAGRHSHGSAPRGVSWAAVPGAPRSAGSRDRAAGQVRGR